jgi:Phage integrase, N-terminal SAM-like domain
VLVRTRRQTEEPQETQQRQASPHTISSYRDTFRQFLKVVQQRLHKPPSRLNFEAIDAPLIVAFLSGLEQHGLSVRSRNLRLTALQSFFRYAAFEAPAHSAQIQRVLAIPSKRFTRTLVQFLTRAEVDAPLAAPDQRTSTRSRPLGERPPCSVTSGGIPIAWRSAIIGCSPSTATTSRFNGRTTHTAIPDDDALRDGVSTPLRPAHPAAGLRTDPPIGVSRKRVSHRTRGARPDAPRPGAPPGHIVGGRDRDPSAGDLDLSAVWRLDDPGPGPHRAPTDDAHARL